MFFYLIIFTPMSFVVHTTYAELLSYKPRVDNSIYPFALLDRLISLFLAKYTVTSPQGTHQSDPGKIYSHAPAVKRLNYHLELSLIYTSAWLES